MQSGLSTGLSSTGLSLICVTISTFRSDNFFSFSFLPFTPFMYDTKAIRARHRESHVTLKSPMTDWLGPLARPRSPIRYSFDSHAWPSPLWAYTMFSHFLCLSSNMPASFPFYSILLHSILFNSTSLRSLSIPFSLLPYSLMISRTLCYINCCTSSRKP